MAEIIKKNILTSARTCVGAYNYFEVNTEINCYRIAYYGKAG